MYQTAFARAYFKSKYCLFQISVLSKMLQDKGLEMKELVEKTLFRDADNKDDTSFPQVAML